MATSVHRFLAFAGKAGAWLAIVLFVFLFAYFGWTNVGVRLLHGDDWYFERETKGHDAPAILAACRELMSDPERYRHHPCRPQWADASLVILVPSTNCAISDLQKGLIVLRPLMIDIRTDRVIVRLNVPDRRIYLVAFAQGVRQFGRRKVIDGLWFWNGYESKENEARP